VIEFDDDYDDDNNNDLSSKPSLKIRFLWLGKTFFVELYESFSRYTASACSLQITAVIFPGYEHSRVSGHGVISGISLCVRKNYVLRPGQSPCAPGLIFIVV
jgi:hypothetical protein